MGYSGAGGKLIDEKNQKQKAKISWHCPFKFETLKAPNTQLHFHTNILRRQPTWSADTHTHTHTEPDNGTLRTFLR